MILVLYPPYPTLPASYPHMPTLTDSDYILTYSKCPLTDSNCRIVSPVIARLRASLHLPKLWGFLPFPREEDRRSSSISAHTMAVSSGFVGPFHQDQDFGCLTETISWDTSEVPVKEGSRHVSFGMDD